MSKIPILDGLMRYIQENNVPFSMPGHKSGRGLLETKEGKDLYENLIRGDITEVDGLDNLHNPDGIIKEAQELLKTFYKSRKSYFLVNGSTSGNLAMIFSAFDEGDKVIVERNCHRSVFNAIIMRKLKPVYIKMDINTVYNAPFSIDMEHFLQLIEEHDDAKGVIITYPNYYGVCMDLDLIIREARKRKMKVLVDSAHGAHFGVNELLPESALKLGADAVVMSAHKTLPSFTQTAYLHVGQGMDTGKVDFYVSAFTSTSPSYMFLAALDYARFYLEEQGKDGFKKCIELANAYRDKINKIPGFHIVSRNDIIQHRDGWDVRIDESRYIISLDKGLNGHGLLQYLREKGIQSEMSDGRNVVMILSPFNKEEDFEKLYEALKDCPLQFLKSDVRESGICSIPETVILPNEAFCRNKKKVRLEDAVGRVSAASIVPYPPGVPLIMLGERIENDALNMIKYCLDNNVTVLGVEDESLEILEDL